MLNLIDEEAANILFFAIARRALDDLVISSTNLEVKNDAQEFLNEHFPDWPRRATRSKRKRVRAIGLRNGR